MNPGRMKGTYSWIYIQVVFGVRGKEHLIGPEWEEELYKYITGIINGKGQKLISINGTEDHVHMLIGIKPDCRLSDLVREIKKASNVFINERKFCKYRFYWQEGFGAFSYHKSMIARVDGYIRNQKRHHRNKSYKEEHLETLNRFGIQADERDFIE